MKLPTVSEMLSLAPDKLHVYSTNQRIDKSLETELLQKFNVGYIFSGFTHGFTEEPALGLLSLIRPQLDNPNEAEIVLDFIDRTYYEKFSSQYSRKDVLQFREASQSYFQTKPYCLAFQKNGKTVACLLANHFAIHPALGRPSLHIGYWGYDRAALGKAEARIIREHWLHCLWKLSAEGAIEVDVSATCFNDSALRLIDKIGFQVRALRLDPRAG